MDKKFTFRKDEREKWKIVAFMCHLGIEEVLKNQLGDFRMDASQ
jgi:hypothetical protein